MQPFDRTLSAKLDCLIYLLDLEPRRAIRMLLRAYKRQLEAGVPR